MNLTDELINRLSTVAISLDDELRTTELLQLDATVFLQNPDARIAAFNLVNVCTKVNTLEITIKFFPEVLPQPQELNSAIDIMFNMIAKKLAENLCKVSFTIDMNENDVEQQIDKEYANTFIHLINKITSTLQSCVQLSDLGLNLIDVDDFWNPLDKEVFGAMKRFLASLPCPEKLSSLIIDLDCLPLGSDFDEAVEDEESINDADNAEEIDNDQTNNIVVNEEEPEITSDIVHLITSASNLRSLKLKNNYFNLDQENSLAKAITKHPSLQEVTLDMIACMLPRHVPPFLQESTLKSLKISNPVFHYQNAPTDVNKEIALAIESNRNLRHLTLELGIYDIDTSPSFVPILEAIARHRSLETLVLNVNLSDESWLKAYKLLSSNPFLTKIGFHRLAPNGADEASKITKRNINNLNVLLEKKGVFSDEAQLVNLITTHDNEALLKLNTSLIQAITIYEKEHLSGIALLNNQEISKILLSVASAFFNMSNTYCIKKIPEDIAKEVFDFLRRDDFLQLSKVTGGAFFRSMKNHEPKPEPTPETSSKGKKRLN